MIAPLVSVVMSVYNGQAFLSEAIESVLGQTFSDFEFVVIDDGSTDATPQILSRYASQDTRIRILRHENKGRAESLNTGIELAQGKYIARMDADDVALPYRLTDQIDFMERHPEVGLLGGAVEVINRTGQILNTYRPPLHDSEIRSMMLRHSAFFHPAVLMRKEVVLASGGYRRALLDADDYDLWLRIGERTRMANLGECLLQYRIHADQVSVRNIRHQTLCVLAARAAASLRTRGFADPLEQVEEVTSKLLDALGVNRLQFQETLAGFYGFWMPILEGSEPDAALRVIDGLLQLSRSGWVERSAIANALLTAARIHYRQGSLAKALVSAGRAVLTRPVVAGRPIKRVFERLVAALTPSKGLQ